MRWSLKERLKVNKEESKGVKRTMEFAFVIHGKSNIAVLLLKQGYAKTALSKFKEENSKYFEQLIEADSHASNNKLGVYSNKAAKIYKFIYSTKNSQSAKSIFSTLSEKGNLKGVIDFWFSGQKFKIRIDTENCYIGFSLIGIKIPMSDQNHPEITEISNTAKEFAKTLLHQRDAVVIVKFIDKKGTFLGTCGLATTQRKVKVRTMLKFYYQNDL